MADDGKDQSQIVQPDFRLALPGVEALVRHGGLSLDAANLTTVFEFGRRRTDAELGPQFGAARFIGGTPAITETFGAGTPVEDALGIVYKAGTLVVPTQDQVKAVKTGAPVIVQKLAR
jgi:hypothetical protein